MARRWTSGACAVVILAVFRFGSFGSVPVPDGDFNESVPRFAYVVSELDNTLTIYSVDPTTGLMQRRGSLPTGSRPISVSVDPSGKFVYATNFGDNTISAYAIDASTGALTPVPGSPFAAGKKPGAVSVDPIGRYAYVTNVSGNSLSAYAIDPETGALTPVAGSPFATGTKPADVATDPDGKFVFVADSHDVAVLSRRRSWEACTTSIAWRTRPRDAQKRGAHHFCGPQLDRPTGFPAFK